MASAYVLLGFWPPLHINFMKLLRINMKFSELNSVASWSLMSISDWFRHFEML